MNSKKISAIILAAALLLPQAVFASEKFCFDLNKAAKNASFVRGPYKAQALKKIGLDATRRF